MSSAREDLEIWIIRMMEQGRTKDPDFQQVAKWKGAEEMEALRQKFTHRTKGETDASGKNVHSGNLQAGSERSGSVREEVDGEISRGGIRYVRCNR